MTAFKKLSLSFQFIVLLIGLGHFGQAVLCQDQLARCSILGINGQHALLDQAREVVPATQGSVIDRLLQALADFLA